MVSPVLLIAVPLGAAFLLPVVRRLGDRATRGLAGLTFAFVLGAVIAWFPALRSGATLTVTTGGWPAPFGIALRFGLAEAVLMALAAAAALGSFGAVSARAGRDAAAGGVRGLVLVLLMVVGTNGLIMTRDLFNTFVFLEIVSIATYALAATGDESRGLEAGFKYMFLGAVASAFILIGIAMLYRLTGTLSIDGIAQALSDAGAASGRAALAPGGAGAAPILGLGVVLLFLFAGFLVELKVFPLNGPAIDLYDGVSPVVMALTVGTALNASVFAFWKLMPIFRAVDLTLVLMIVGSATFVLANLFALRQTRVRRMLGYSTSAQLGLIVMLMPLAHSGEISATAVGLLLVNHTLAKAGLLWFAGSAGKEKLVEWKGALAGSPVARFSLAALVLAIVGLPPFPGFWGKWDALVALARGPHAWWIIPVLAGSLLEFIYYFRWLRLAHARAGDSAARPAAIGSLLPAHAFGIIALGAGLALSSRLVTSSTDAVLVLAGAGLVLLVAGHLPGRLLQFLSLVALAASGWMLHQTGSLAPTAVTGFFMLIVLFGAFTVLLAGVGTPPDRKRYHGLFLLLVASLVLLVDARSPLGFFAGWELMTWTSYLLVAQGERGGRPAFRYMLFSGAAGFLVLGGILVALSAGVTTIADFTRLGGATALWAAILLGAGFAVKAASAGTHVWAPDAYTESPDLFSTFLSGVLSKMPLFGIVLFGTRLIAGADPLLIGGTYGPGYALGWLGAVTAISMTLFAALQEDAKRLLAYSSVGQIGYAVVGFALLTPLGWSAALYHSVNHMLIKLLLFLAIAAVVNRTGTRRMHEMGGLIKKMPAQYIAVLIGIIALSGVPPLSGFAGKWLIYNALIEKEWYFIAGVLMFASVIAFLYLFRLINTIFLGQLKPRHREVREAPAIFVVAQALLVFAIMGLSMFPDALLRVTTAMTAPFFGEQGVAFAANGSLLVSLGYLNAFGVMAMVMGLFAIFFAWVLFLGPKTTKVRQLDIVMAAEEPPAPEEIHYAYDFYRPYKRAFAPVLRVSVERGWSRFAALLSAVAERGRRFYTGDAQTYLLYAVVFLGVVAAAVLSRLAG